MSRVREITSDSTILKIHTEPDLLILSIRLYTEKSCLVRFKGYISSFTRVGWDQEGAVDGVFLNDESKFLADAMDILEGEFEGTPEGYHCYQIVDGYKSALVEIVAQLAEVEMLLD